MKTLEQMAKKVNSGKFPTPNKESKNLAQNAFFVLEHSCYKRVIVNPTKFSFLAFWGALWA